MSRVCRRTASEFVILFQNLCHLGLGTVLLSVTIESGSISIHVVNYMRNNTFKSCEITLKDISVYLVNTNTHFLQTALNQTKNYQLE